MKFRGKKKNFGGGGWTDFNLKMPSRINQKCFFMYFRKCAKLNSPQTQHGKWVLGQQGSLL